LASGITIDAVVVLDALTMFIPDIFIKAKQKWRSRTGTAFVGE